MGIMCHLTDKLPIDQGEESAARLTGTVTAPRQWGGQAEKDMMTRSSAGW
jgi:hypothetical protein